MHPGSTRVTSTRVPEHGPYDGQRPLPENRGRAFSVESGDQNGRSGSTAMATKISVR